MMRIFFVAILIAFASAAQGNEFWTNLWHNADQQGDALMQHGDATDAAKLYSDPRRKAYAKLQAGDYLGAAQDLGKLHDSDSDYNRGNALAHAGDLQGALGAYDAALKSDPKNQDAKHNRELVANAMKQQSAKSQDEKGQQGQNSSGSKKPDDKGQQDKNTSKSDQAANQSGKASSQNNAQQKEKSPDTKSQDGKAGQSGREQGKSSQEANSASANNAARQSSAKPDGKNGIGDEISAARTSDSTRSEQQMAEEQWLRSIPDDPGGLLRRKFLIEHMIRQSEQ